MVSRATFAVATLLLAAMPTVAGATGIVQTGDQVKILSNQSGVHAGPFQIDDLTNPKVATFPSFCIEYSETILINGTYFAKLADVAVGGGRSRFDPVANALVGNAGEDPLSVGTAYLYRQFLDGTLAGYSGDAASRDGLQLAFWRLEGEAGLLGGNYVLLNSNGLANGAVVPGSNAASVAKANQFYADAIDPLGKGTYASYDVRVMQLWANYNQSTQVYGGARQDQIVSVRASVPEPISTFSALLLGVSALGLAR